VSSPESRLRSRESAGGDATSTEPIVFVVDDDASMREALDGLLRSAGLNPRTFASAGAFLQHTRPDVAACLILDVRMPGLSGLELQRELAEQQHAVPIIFLTGHGDIPTTVRAMKAGAAEFLSKPFCDDELLDAVRQALEHDQLARQQRSEVGAIQSQYDRLTLREREVVALVVKGMLNKQAASQLGITEITIKVHRRHIMQKMKARSLPELVRMIGRLPVKPRMLGAYT
jgi:FixJ family two-component response regulator